MSIRQAFPCSLTDTTLRIVDSQAIRACDIPDFFVSRLWVQATLSKRTYSRIPSVEIVVQEGCYGAAELLAPSIRTLSTKKRLGKTPEVKRSRKNVHKKIVCFFCVFC